MKLDLNRMGVRASDLIIRPSSDNNSAKVLPPLEKALMDVIIEWND
jgi:hypothetical protein